VWEPKLSVANVYLVPAYGLEVVNSGIEVSVAVAVDAQSDREKVWDVHAEGFLFLMRRMVEAQTGRGLSRPLR